MSPFFWGKNVLAELGFSARNKIGDKNIGKALLHNFKDDQKKLTKYIVVLSANACNIIVTNILVRKILVPIFLLKKIGDKIFAEKKLVTKFLLTEILSLIFLLKKSGDKIIGEKIEMDRYICSIRWVSQIFAGDSSAQMLAILALNA